MKGCPSIIGEGEIIYLMCSSVSRAEDLGLGCEDGACGQKHFSRDDARVRLKRGCRYGDPGGSRDQRISRRR
jgi:hypothetical protein